MSTPSVRSPSRQPAVPAGQPDQSVRAAAFSDLRTADLAVSRLLTAGFSPEQITVVCSDAAKERHFREFEHQEQAGEHAGNAALAGTAFGALAGGLTAIAVAAATGGVPLLIAGAAGLAGGSATGTFLGAMLTRGDEKEVSNFYDQAIRHDEILVSVEEHGPQAGSRLAEAARIFAETGARVIKLPEG